MKDRLFRWLMTIIVLIVVATWPKDMRRRRPMRRRDELLRDAPTPPNGWAKPIEAQGASLIYEHEGKLYVVPVRATPVDSRPPWRFAASRIATFILIVGALLILARFFGWMAGHR